MKKEIMNLLNNTNEEAYFRINNISYLRRWTKDALGNDVDRLTLEFDCINDVRFSVYDSEIKSRDYDGIIKECQELTQKFTDEIARTLCKNLGAGYRNVTKTTV